MSKAQNPISPISKCVVALLILGIPHPSVTQPEAPKAEPQFQAAEANSVADLPVPVGSSSSGTVVLDALLSDSGAVERVEVRRDVIRMSSNWRWAGIGGIPDFTQMAREMVQNSKFSAARMAGKPIASRIPVAVCFRPPYAFCDPATLPSLIPQSEQAIQASFQPAELLRPAYPDYPPNTVAWGTVTLEVKIGNTGKAGDVKVLRDLPPWTERAELAVSKWRFMAATLNGHPVSSKILVVFVINIISNEPPPLPLSSTGPN